MLILMAVSSLPDIFSPPKMDIYELVEVEPAKFKINIKLHGVSVQCGESRKCNDVRIGKVVTWMHLL